VDTPGGAAYSRSALTAGDLTFRARTSTVVVMNAPGVAETVSIIGGAALGVVLSVGHERSLRRVLLAIAAYFGLTVLLGLIAAFAGVADPGASSKATALAQGLSAVMNCGGWGITAGCLVGGGFVLGRVVRGRFFS
jgi:hypothetical protein